MKLKKLIDFASESTKVAEALYSLFKDEKKKFSKIKIFTRVLRFRPFWTILVPCLSVCVSVMNSL